VLEVSSISGHKIVITNHLMPSGDQKVTKVRANETGSPRYDETQTSSPLIYLS